MERMRVGNVIVTLEYDLYYPQITQITPVPSAGFNPGFPRGLSRPFTESYPGEIRFAPY